MDNGASSYRRFLDGDDKGIAEIVNEYKDYAIGRNTAVDYIRHNSRLSSISAEDMEKYLKDEKSLEKSYIKEESKIALHKALSKLPADYRSVLWLVYFEDFSNAEAASVMKKSDRQIKNLLYRAKQSLKSILEKEGFVYEE